MSRTTVTRARRTHTKRSSTSPSSISSVSTPSPSRRTPQGVPYNVHTMAEYGIGIDSEDAISSSSSLSSSTAPRKGLGTIEKSSVTSSQNYPLSTRGRRMRDSNQSRSSPKKKRGAFRGRVLGGGSSSRGRQNSGRLVELIHNVQDHFSLSDNSAGNESPSSSSLSTVVSSSISTPAFENEDENEFVIAFQLGDVRKQATFSSRSTVEELILHASELVKEIKFPIRSKTGKISLRFRTHSSIPNLCSLSPSTTLQELGISQRELVDVW